MTHPDPPRFVGDEQDLTDSDRMIVQSGAILHDGATVILPSGRLITAEQWKACGGRNS